MVVEKTQECSIDLYTCYPLKSLCSQPEWETLTNTLLTKAI